MNPGRTSFLAVIVAEEQLPEAIDFCREAFGTTLSATSPMDAADRGRVHDLSAGR